MGEARIQKGTTDRARERGSNQSGHVQKLSFEIATTVVETTQHSLTKGTSFNFETSFEAEIPKVAKMGIKMNHGLTHSVQWGESQSFQTTRRRQVELSVGPGQTLVAELRVKSKQLQVPFTATFRLDNGNIEHVHGIWKGISYDEGEVHWIPASGDTDSD